MINYKTKLRPWGNSLGIVIPKSKIQEEGLGIDDTIRVSISPAKGLRASDLFGKLDSLHGSTAKDLEEIDRELDTEL